LLPTKASAVNKAQRKLDDNQNFWGRIIVVDHKTQRFAFSHLTNMTEVRWQQLSPGHQFDNILARQRSTNFVDWQSFRTNRPRAAWLLDADRHPGRLYFYRVLWNE